MMRRRRVSARLGVATILAASIALVTAMSAGSSALAAARTADSGVYLDSLQMTSASTGWALRWTSNPGATSGPAPYLIPARTVDGARRWTTIAPRGSRALLSTPFATVVLRALNGRRAWLAVTAASSANQFPGDVHRTLVYVTGDGGRTWTRSAALNVPGFAEFLSFPDARHGWLLEDMGSEDVLMGADYADVYRTVDGGLRWSEVAHTPAPPSTAVSKSGLPVMCDKAGLAFATPSAGWLAGACNNLSYALRATRDGGTHWSAQALPIPADTCSTTGCEIFGPQFFGRTGFMSLARAPAAPYFLVSNNVGKTWRTRALPSGGGLDPRITFFSARDGVLVSAGTQGSIGTVFYTTANGGRTWTAVPQGTAFTQLGVAFDFVSTRIGYAWVLATDSPGATAPQMYRTDNSGRTWTPFTPVTGR
jgi:hypothetical protein